MRSTIHNFYDEYPVGMIVVLDKGTTCETRVEVLFQSPNRMFSAIRPVGCADKSYQCQVMTNRLSFEL